VWRSLVAHLNGVQEVPRSNRGTPTTNLNTSGAGVVADAEIAGPAERRVVTFAKDAARFPWSFSVHDVRFYFDSPIAIDAALRAQLDAFVKHGHDPSGPWSWLVQGTRYLTAHDFAVLTRR
jgi:hypothetical protein